MGKPKNTAYKPLTVNLDQNITYQSDLYTTIIERAKDKGQSVSVVLRDLLLDALKMPPAPAPNADLADLIARLVYLESLAATGGLTAEQHFERSNIVERIREGKPAPMLADDFKRGE